MCCPPIPNGSNVSVLVSPASLSPQYSALFISSGGQYLVLPVFAKNPWPFWVPPTVSSFLAASSLLSGHLLCGSMPSVESATLDRLSSDFSFGGVCCLALPVPPHLPPPTRHSLVSCSLCICFHFLPNYFPDLLGGMTIWSCLISPPFSALLCCCSLWPDTLDWRQYTLTLESLTGLCGLDELSRSMSAAPLLLPWTAP